MYKEKLGFKDTPDSLPFSKLDDSKECSGQLIPDTTLSFSSARAGANPPLNW